MYTFLGVRVVNFTANDGKKIEGAQFWFMPFESENDDNVTGYIPEKKWVSLSTLAAMGGISSLSSIVNKQVDPQLDLRGRLIGLKVIK